MLWIEAGIVLLMIVLNGLLAMSELAVVSSRRSRLKSVMGRRSRGARIAVELLDSPTRFLSTVQIGITLVGVLAGAFSGATLASRLGEWLNARPILAPHGETIAMTLVVAAVTYASLVIGELVPKRIALVNPEQVASLVAPMMQRLAKAAGPAVWLLKASTDAVVNLAGLGGVRRTAVTEDEVRALIAEGARTGVFVAREREMIDAVLRLADRRVRAIMTPRTDVIWLEEHAALEDIGPRIARSRRSRFPVCRETIDNPLGIVHTKDLVQALLQQEPIVLTACMAPPLVVPETLPALELLELFRQEKIHMALVVDEYGTTEGVVTPTDILESIAGDLPGRSEQFEPGLVRRDDGSWLLDGDLPIDEFEDRLGVRGLRDAGFDTVAGLVLHRMGRLPSVGDAFETDEGRFEVIDMDGRRIDKILYVPAPDDVGV
jgi:putative hemolysin